MKELRAEVAVVGGGVGGVAAAWAAARLGRRVVLVSAFEWLGGQLSTQGVPPDEHPWIEMFGASESYRTFRRAVRDFYRRHYPLTPEARERHYLNPGDAWVSPLAHEPRVSAQMIAALLAPLEASGHLRVLRGYRPVRAEAWGDRVRLVELEGAEGRATLEADYFLDATELGDLLELAGAEHVLGAEGQAETGEPHAAPVASPLNQQSFTWVLALEHRPGEDHTIERPEMYGFWRAYQAPGWPAPQLGWVFPHHVTLAPLRAALDFADPRRAYAGRKGRVEMPPGPTNLWTYRRVLNAQNFAGDYRDVSVVNWPQNDYWLRPLLGAGQEERARAELEAKQLSLSLLYWMQTEAPRPDGGTGYPELRPHLESFGTPDGLAPEPYIRESRRIRAEFTVLEQHLAKAERPHGPQKFPDSVGIGAYRIDLHPSTGGDPFIDLATWPHQIPLGALLPVRLENLLPAGKNLGTTHLTNGCYRLHPVEWSVGEAAGLLAAHCLQRRALPRAVRADEAELRDFQRLLVQQGIELDWPVFRAL